MCKLFRNIFGKRKLKPYRTHYKPHLSSNTTRQELSLGVLINAHRDKLSLPPLEFDALACNVAKKHCKNMVKDGVANHDRYPERRKELLLNNALEIGEVVADGFQTAKGFMKGYLNSEKHRQIIEGNYTHFGPAILENKKNYCVVEFVKY